MARTCRPYWGLLGFRSSRFVSAASMNSEGRYQRQLGETDALPPAKLSGWITQGPARKEKPVFINQCSYCKKEIFLQFIQEFVAQMMEELRS